MAYAKISSILPRPQCVKQKLSIELAEYTPWHMIDELD